MAPSGYIKMGTNERNPRNGSKTVLKFYEVYRSCTKFWDCIQRYLLTLTVLCYNLTKQSLNL